MEKQTIFVIVSNDTDLPTHAVDKESEAIEFCTNEQNSESSWLTIPFYKYMTANEFATP
jgi:hypothetical protein